MWCSRRGERSPKESKNSTVGRIVEQRAEIGRTKASRKLPTLLILRLAKAADVKFTFGTNGRTANVIGQLDYSLAMARRLELTAADLFIPRS